MALRSDRGDCLDLDLPDGCADVVTISFGLRNLEDRHRGLQEMHRILRKPNGVLLILEFTQPAAWVRPFYSLYLKCGLPLIAALATGEPGAYRYLTSSIRGFPNKGALSDEIRQAGFQRVDVLSMTGSLVAIHRAQVE